MSITKIMMLWEIAVELEVDLNGMVLLDFPATFTKNVTHDIVIMLM